MNDPNKGPMRTSQPSETEFDKSVPHDADKAVAMSGKSGEGSYEGTKKYAEGYEKFAEKKSPDDAVKQAKEINPDDPSLEQAHEQGKSGRTSQNGGTGGRISAPSIH